MEAIVCNMPPTGDIDIDTYNDWKAKNFPVMEEFAKAHNVSAWMVSKRITNGLAKLKALKQYNNENAEIFVKHLPSQMFCAALESINDLHLFLSARAGKIQDFVWYTRDKVKKCTGFDPSRIKIHAEYCA